MLKGWTRVWMFLTPVAFACGNTDPTVESLAIASDDARFQIELHTSASPGQLRLRVEPRRGWKLVPESPARLRVEAPPGVSFDRLEQASEDALEYSEERLEFALDLQSEAGAATLPQREARADLKFGVCVANSSHCEIVRERITLPLELANR